MKKSIIQQVAELPKGQRDLFPEIRVDMEPVFEVTTPAPDMRPIADALREFIEASKEDEDDKPKRTKIDVERDGRGFIKSLTCTRLTD